MASKTAQALIDGLTCKHELKVRLSMYRHALLQIEAREERIAELEAVITIARDMIQNDGYSSDVWFLLDLHADDSIYRKDEEAGE